MHWEEKWKKKFVTQFVDGAESFSFVSFEGEFSSSQSPSILNTHTHTYTHLSSYKTSIQVNLININCNRRLINHHLTIPEFLLWKTERCKRFFVFVSNHSIVSHWRRQKVVSFSESLIRSLHNFHTCSHITQRATQSFSEEQEKESKEIAIWVKVCKWVACTIFFWMSTTLTNYWKKKKRN